jgi:hypothetical protein
MGGSSFVVEVVGFGPADATQQHAALAVQELAGGSTAITAAGGDGVVAQP